MRNHFMIESSMILLKVSVAYDEETWQRKTILVSFSLDGSYKDFQSFSHNRLYFMGIDKPRKDDIIHPVVEYHLTE